MFSDQDFANYFSAVEDALKNILVEATDFASQLTNKALLSKMEVILQEDIEILRFIREQKSKFSSQQGL